ncbi:MAG: cell division protein ZapD [Gammaproteobacteria bacterium]|nr:cell division protein ZapD [Gammaproteobacteria bacterium]
MTGNLVYEQPLNERVRTFLRLEHLFDALDHRSSGSSEWDSRDALINLLSITDILSRSDIKSELIKELERHASTLDALRTSRGVDQNRLKSILDNITGLLVQLKDKQCQPGQLIKHSDLMNSVKQRSSIPGGSCNFDLPGFHFWLNRPHAERVQVINRLCQDLLVIRESMALALHMIRNSTAPTTEEAENGFFQKPFDNNLSCHLVRVVLDQNSPYFPEISGGKHRFSIRFMEQPDSSARPVQTKNNVNFTLHCCIL